MPGSTAGSTSPCARPASTAGRAARRSRRSARNVDFYRSAAAAQQRGFRACKRCRPDASPGSPEWDVRGDLVGRAMRLIADGVVDREGVTGLSRRLGYSVRHLNRMLTDELGAGPLALARAQRAQTARTLIETTELGDDRHRLRRRASAACASSTTPFARCTPSPRASCASATRTAARRVDAGTVSVRLAARRAVRRHGSCSAFLGAPSRAGRRALGRRRRTRVPLELPHGHGTVELRAADDHIAAHVPARRLARPGAGRRPRPASARPRRRPDVDRRGARRPIPTCAAGRAHAGTARRRVGRRRRDAGAGDRRPAGVGGRRAHRARAHRAVDRRTADVERRPADPRLFPSMDRLAEASTSDLPMPVARADTLRRVGQLVVDGADRSRPRRRPGGARRATASPSAASARGPPTTS